MDFQQLLDSITPEIYERFKKAVELGKWPDTRPLSDEQKSLCMQAIIAYELKQSVPEAERTGYVPPKATPCDSEDHSQDEQPLKWQS
ncbi:MAG: YeaC family protein [Porticoccaceae bacterium]